MSIFSEHLSREEFENRYDAPKTKEMVRYALREWDKFCKATYPDVSEPEILKQLRESQGDERYLLLDKVVRFWNDKEPSTIKILFTYLKSWFRVQGIKTHNEEIKDYVKFPKKVKEIKRPLTVETIKKLLDDCDKQYRAFFLIQASSGMREGETMKLLLKDIDVTKNPVLVHVKGENTKLKSERFTFISSEAYNALKPLLDGKKPTDQIFNITTNSLQKYMTQLRRKTGLLEKYGEKKSGQPRYHVNVHAFRSFFRTRASDVIGQEAAYFLLGQEGYLSQYYRLTEDDAAQKYRQLEPYITISDENRYKTELEKANEKLTKVDDVDTRLAKLEDYIKMMAEANSTPPRNGQSLHQEKRSN